MSARIIDGRALGRRLRAGFRGRAARLAAAGLRPGLAVIVVGDNPASKLYVGRKPIA